MCGSIREDHDNENIATLDTGDITGTMSIAEVLVIAVTNNQCN